MKKTAEATSKYAPSPRSSKSRRLRRKKRRMRPDPAKAGKIGHSLCTPVKMSNCSRRGARPPDRQDPEGAKFPLNEGYWPLPPPLSPLRVAGGNTETIAGSQSMPRWWGKSWLLRGPIFSSIRTLHAKASASPGQERTVRRFFGGFRRVPASIGCGAALQDRCEAWKELPRTWDPAWPSRR